MSTENNGIGIFEKWLSLWVTLSIVLGIVLGQIWPDIFSLLTSFEYAHVNFVIAVLIWAMVYPMMVSVDFGSIRHVAEQPKGLFITLVINWLIKPFTMAALGVFFFKFLFIDLITAPDADSYIAGLILLGAAPCTAMVFVWSQLTRGDANYTLVQVSINDLVMIFAYAPIVAVLLGVTDIPVPWGTLVLSVVLYVIVPLLAGVVTRKIILSTNRTNKAISNFTAALKPFSILGLLATVVLLFGFQGNVILANPTLIIIIAIPLLVQSYGIFAVAYFAAWFMRVPFRIAAPCALIGTSNFFELAVAVAIGLFGLNSGAALTTVVGVLVEVPVMLSLVALANRTQIYFPRK
ncbi:arsenic transporter [Kiloniella litopenaei]|uniref:Arsenic transporter n=1 Tax=Kiloniella litopenaei TaxID=1549748 RepID=A0A0M2R6Q1_9PROT|nr:ACR3 family arsenite efflux transporter [Kiloniella litopenaei]KKJ77361.1 arsenic transporter [Kiloniella litopenaei]